MQMLKSFVVIIKYLTVSARTDHFEKQTYQNKEKTYLKPKKYIFLN